MKQGLLNLDEPVDYFSGLGSEPLPHPLRILLFHRTTQNKLQQAALQNRSHHRHVLIFNLGTQGHVHADNLVLPFKPGQALLILPYQFHHFSKLQSQHLEWLFCTFELEDPSMLQPMRNRVIDTGSDTSTLLEQLLEIWHLPASRLQASRLQASLVCLLLALRQQCEQNAPDLLPEVHDNLLQTVNRLMEQWRGRTVGISDIADAMGYSGSRLRVLFKQAAGITLGAYIKNFRLNRAMSLLRTSTLSISEIANEAGFASPQAFSRNFKKETGLTPRNYRQHG